MATVVTVNGVSSFTRKAKLMEKVFPKTTHTELARVAARKLKKVYGFKHDTGRLKNSIRWNADKSSGIVFLGGEETTRRRGKRAPFDYSIALEEGYQGHPYSSLNMFPGGKISRIPSRMLKTRTKKGLFGRIKAIRRAEAEIGLRTGKIFSKVWGGK